MMASSAPPRSNAGAATQTGASISTSTRSIVFRTAGFPSTWFKQRSRSPDHERLLACTITKDGIASLLSEFSAHQDHLATEPGRGTRAIEGAADVVHPRRG